MNALRTRSLATWVFGLVALHGCSDDDNEDGSGSDTGTTSTSSSTSTSGSGSTGSSTSTTGEGSTTGSTSTTGTTSESTGGLLANGEECGGSDECVSGSCYFINGIGVCSECLTEADCTTGGCSPANTLVDPPQAAFCNNGALGEACNTDAACADGRTCQQVLDVPEAGIELSTCSDCTMDEQCEAGQSCAPQFDLQGFVGYMTCVADGSTPLGGGCSTGGSGDAQCASGICTEIELFFGALTLGICGECRNDADCTVDGEECLLPWITDDLEIVPPQCGVPADTDTDGETDGDTDAETGTGSGTDTE